MKKLLMISYQFPPGASSGVFRFLRFFKELPRCGWQPYVLTVRPEYYPASMPKDYDLLSKIKASEKIVKTKMWPSLEIILDKCHYFNLRISNKQKISSHLDEKIVQTKLDKQSYKSSLWQSVKDFVSLSLMIPDKQNRWLYHALKEGKKILTENDIRLIYAHGGPWTALVAGTLLHKKSDLPLVIDFRDPWLDNPYDDLNRMLRKKINTILEKWCVKQATFVIANTDALKNLFIQKYPYLSEKKFITILNSYDDEDYNGLKIKPVKSAEVISVIHAGTLYAKRSPLPFLSIVSDLIKEEKIKRENIEILFLGKIDIDGIESFIEENALKSIIKMPGHLPRRKALESIFNADILLLLQQGTDLQIPAKLFEYIRTGNPIFAICDGGATKDLITENCLGIVCDPKDNTNMKKRFLEMFSTILSSKKRGVVSPFNITPRVIKRFSSEVQTRLLAKIFEKSLEK